MKRICALAVAIVLALSCAALAETGTFSYVITDGEAFVTGYAGSDAVVSIPATIEGCPVTTVAGGAFLNLASITDVTVPASVTYIGDAAFMGCASLEKVAIQGADCEIGKLAFKGCDRALTISAPAGSAAERYAEDGGIAFEALVLSDADLYAQARSALEAGDIETAQALLEGLDDYEDSRDLYIYATARLYEQGGEADAAVALYGLVPGTLDAGDRLAALEKGAAAGDETQTDGIIIGGKLNKNKATEAPATAEPAPTVEPTPEPSPLISFHEFIGGMPYEFDDNSREEGMYTIYYYVDDFAQLDAYRALFTGEGWAEIDEGADSDGWSYVYVTAPDGSASFYIAYVEAEDMVVFMYDSEADYGFDPLKGL